jgi:hypothetical protein
VVRLPPSRVASAALAMSKNKYKKALDNGLSPSTQQLVSIQFAEIKAAHDRIRSLRDATQS